VHAGRCRTFLTILLVDTGSRSITVELDRMSRLKP
jgi:hypothetical protein